jgi:GTP cyclohydrolase II
MEAKMNEGIDSFSRRIQRQKVIYGNVLAESEKCKGKIFRVRDKELFKEVIENFGPILHSHKAKSDLMRLYEIGLHKESGALIISNKGATLYCLSPKSETPYLARHIGFCIHLPDLGVEFVNVALVGDVYSGKVVLRGESACTPSFLFGSQRCNCAHQWANITELAAHFNKINPPKVSDGKEFESWVQKQLDYKEGKHIHLLKTRGPGFILMHLDTQNGMGSGYSDGEFAFDLYSRASMRHRGEYSAEQIEKVSMKGGFEAIGLNPDPRKEKDCLGYKTTFIVLDYLNVSKDLIFLTNNPLKLQHLERNGYNLTRMKSVGMINLAGAQEAEERHLDFDHLDINGKPISFKEEFERLKNEIKSLILGQDD